MAGNQTVPTNTRVTDFIAAIDDDTKRADAKTLIKMMREVTGEKPVIWGPAIVGFGSYHYQYESGREGDMPLAAFSPRAAGSTIYIHFGLSAAKPLLAKLGKHKLSGGCLHIRRLADVDVSVLKRIVEVTLAATLSRPPPSGWAWRKDRNSRRKAVLAK